MARMAYLLPALALSLQLGAQGTPAGEAGKGRDSVAAPTLTANQGVQAPQAVSAHP